METYIKISTLNDFVFCPKSIYFHDLYQKYSTKNYHTNYQKEWKMNHSNIDKKKYSTSKKILQGMTVYSEKYNLLWKIDLYHIDKQSLIERKTKIKKIYDGQKFQIWAQMFCLEEMGYPVKKMQIYSLKDNKTYPIDRPEWHRKEKFEQTIRKYHVFDTTKKWFSQNPNKCKMCIYRELCDVAEIDEKLMKKQ